MVEIPQKRAKIVEDDPEDEDPINTDRKMIKSDDIELNVKTKVESKFHTQTWSE